MLKPLCQFDNQITGKQAQTDREEKIQDFFMLIAFEREAETSQNKSTELSDSFSCIPVCCQLLRRYPFFVVQIPFHLYCTFWSLCLLQLENDQANRWHT